MIRNKYGYLLNINSEITTKNSTIRLLSKEIKDTSRGNVTSYKYICQKCSNIDTITQGDIKRGYGCNVCCIPSRKVLKGYNDLWTTHVELAKLLKFKNIGYEISHGMKRKEIFVCPNCNHELEKYLFAITKRGFSCTKCSDGISYPEKFMISVLDQLEIVYEYQKYNFKWSKGKRYDFYIPSYNMIIETNGSQHSNSAFCSLGGRTLKEEQENDRLKEKLAKDNKVNTYVIIDCSYSNMEYIRNNIIKSKLNSIFDLTAVNWLKCHEFACKSLVKEACDLWKRTKYTPQKIGELMSLSRQTIISYLKQGAKLEWCKYDPKEIMVQIGKRNGGKNARSIVQLDKINNLIRYWDNINGASITLGIKDSNISQVCKGKYKTSGGYKWMYLEDYEKYIMQSNIR